MADVIIERNYNNNNLTQSEKKKNSSPYMLKNPQYLS